MSDVEIRTQLVFAMNIRQAMLPPAVPMIGYMLPDGKMLRRIRGEQFGEDIFQITLRYETPRWNPDITRLPR